MTLKGIRVTGKPIILCHRTIASSQLVYKTVPDGLTIVRNVLTAAEIEHLALAYTNVKLQQNSDAVDLAPVTEPLLTQPMLTNSPDDRLEQSIKDPRCGCIGTAGEPKPGISRPLRGHRTGCAAPFRLRRPSRFRACRRQR